MSDVYGLLLAADLALSEAKKRFSGVPAGSHKDKAKIELASALQSIEMARYHMTQVALEESQSQKK